MTANLEFELVSPEKLLVSKKVAMVTVPGGEGEYGVLAGHAPMITTVQPGVISIYAEDENAEPSERLFVAGGFAEVTPERCTVLADESVPVAELNRATLEQRAKEIAEELASLLPDTNRTALLAEQQVVAAKIAVIS